MPNHTVPAAAIGLPLSPLFVDPFLRRAFERVERDDGAMPVLASRPGPRLSGGSAVRPTAGRQPMVNAGISGRSPEVGYFHRGLTRTSIEAEVERLMAILDGHGEADQREGVLIAEGVGA